MDTAVLRVVPSSDGRSGRPRRPRKRVMGADDLNPTATGLTTKEVLLEVRSDVKQIGQDLATIRQDVTVLTSQDLNSRLDKIETWKDKVDGRVNALIFLVTIAGGILGIVISLRVLFPPGG